MRVLLAIWKGGLELCRMGPFRRTTLVRRNCQPDDTFLSVLDISYQGLKHCACGLPIGSPQVRYLKSLN